MNRDLKTLLLNSVGPDKDRKRVAYEVHYRMPRRLGRAFQATHFTLTRRSAEDYNFDSHRSRVEQIFHPEKNIKFRELVMDSNAGASSNEWDAIRVGYLRVLNDESSLFVFGAFGRVVDLVSRAAVDAIGQTPDLMSALKIWRERFEEFVDSMELSINLASSSPDFSDDLGSTRFWLERDHRNGKDGWPYAEGTFSDFRHIRLENRYKINDSVGPGEFENEEMKDRDGRIKESFEYFLRWLRSPQSWNYTFIESLNQTGQDHLHYIDSVSALLTASALEPSVLRALALADAPLERNFPGRLLAGAHYFLIPLDMLLALSLIPPARLGVGSSDEVLPRFYAIRKGSEGNADYGAAVRLAHAIKSDLIGRRSLVAILLERSLEVLGRGRALEISRRHWAGTGSVERRKHIRSDLEYLISRVFEIESNSRGQYLATYLKDISEDQAPIDDRGLYRFLGNLVKTAIVSPETKMGDKSALLQSIAELTRMFWDFAVAPNLASQKAARTQELGIAADDFVCSSMIDGRCLYFSNFLPENDDLFTRTLFIDIGMEGFQSARVLQRLSDILTYRSMPIRYLGRINAAVEALLELNMKINSLQSEGARTCTKPKEAGRERHDGDAILDLERLQKQLTEAMSISRKIAKLNGFITYGISGQWRSAQAYHAQIVERCEDLRESRIAGYPMLTDFVRRRLAHSIRFVERMHDHQQTVMRRITEVLDRIRTELNARQASEISTALKNQGDTIRELQEVTKRMDGNIVAQAHLLKSAEALILIGSTYYLASYFLSYIARSVGWAFGIGGAVISFALAFIMSFGFMAAWPYVNGLVHSWFERKVPASSRPGGQAGHPGGGGDPAAGVAVRRE